MLRDKTVPLSGAAMSKTLGISRSAVWKHIRSLRQEGYRIEAQTASGYRLVAVPSHPTPWEIQAGLGTDRFGRKIHLFQQVTSTNAVAFRLARRGEQEGAVVLAEAQTAGKGRMGRRWESPGGANIYLSLILRPHIPPTNMPLITLMTAVAGAEAIGEVMGRLPEIKWPNDLLFSGRKVGGILTEADMEMDAINFVVVGIGINVNMRRRAFPAVIRDTATSLQEESGKEIARIPLIQAVIQGMERWYDILAQGRGKAIRERWQELARIKGKKVAVSFMHDIVKGMALGLDEDGALLVESDNGTVRRIVAGDVTVGEG